jgi:hypothetical protein
MDVPGTWFARYGAGLAIDMVVDKAAFVEKFGKVFVDELKAIDRGFVDVPVGQSKESCLHNYLLLSVLGAPSIRFTQSERW